MVGTSNMCPFLEYPVNDGDDLYLILKYDYIYIYDMCTLRFPEHDGG